MKLLIACISMLLAVSAFGATTQTNYPIRYLKLVGDANGNTNSFTNLVNVSSATGVFSQAITLGGVTITNWQFGTSATNYTDAATNTLWIATTNLVTSATNAIYITSTNAAIQAILALNYVTASVTNGLASLAYVDSATNVLWIATTNAIAGSQPQGVAYLVGTNTFTGASNTFTGPVWGNDRFGVRTTLSDTNGATAFSAAWPTAAASPYNVRWNPTNTLGNIGYIVSAQGYRQTDTNGVWQWELSTMPVTNVTSGNVVIGSVSNGMLTITDANVARLDANNTFTSTTNWMGSVVVVTNNYSISWASVTGTVIAHTNTTAITGTGTSFLTDLQTNGVLRTSSALLTVGVIASIVDDSNATLAANSLIDTEGETMEIGTLQTNAGGVLFADGSFQTAAFSNSAAQITALGFSTNAILGVEYGAGTGTTTNAGVVTIGTNALVNTNSSLQGIINGLSERDPVLTLGVDSTGVFANITTSPAGNLEYWFGNSLISYGTSQFVRLTAGTTNTPSLNYICAMADGTVSNYTEYPYFPESTNTRAFMFEVFLMDTNAVAEGTGYAIRSWTENVGTRRGLGRVSWIGERVRRLPAIWESGVQASCSSTNASTNDCFVTTTSGVGWQMHSHTIPANTNRTPMWIINHAAGFQTATNLQQIVSDSNGAAVLAGNGDCFAVNLFAFVESGITPKNTRLMLTLSTDDYSVGTAAVKLANCIADSSSLDVTGVPVWMQGMTIRLARIVIRRDSATARTYWIYDRRGQPLGTAGGGSSSSGESDPIYEADLANGLTGATNLILSASLTGTQGTYDTTTRTLAVPKTDYGQFTNVSGDLASSVFISIPTAPDSNAVLVIEATGRSTKNATTDNFSVTANGLMNYTVRGRYIGASAGEGGGTGQTNLLLHSITAATGRADGNGAGQIKIWNAANDKFLKLGVYSAMDVRDSEAASFFLTYGFIMSTNSILTNLTFSAAGGNLTNYNIRCGWQKSP